MNILLVCYHIEPMKTSAAVQMRDLARAFQNSGHNAIFLAPSERIDEPVTEETKEGVRLIRIRADRNEGAGNLLRAWHEFKMAVLVPLRIGKTSIANVAVDAVVWYSPSIFFGPFIWYLRFTKNPKCFLILRDIFPDWMLSLGLIKRGMGYAILKFVAHIQYLAADVIGVQSPSDLKLLEHYRKPLRRSLVVLNNWQYPSPTTEFFTFDLEQSSLRGRKVIAHLGNLGVAQGFDMIIDVATHLRSNKDIGFLLMGRGTEAERLKKLVSLRGLDNVLFHDEVDPSEVPNVLAQCTVGLVSLHHEHIGQNIPGKFLTYLLCGKPVLAKVGENSDLGKLISEKEVGLSYSGVSAAEMATMAVDLVSDSEGLREMSLACKSLAQIMFYPNIACRSILESLDLKTRSTTRG